MIKEALAPSLAPYILGNGVDTSIYPDLPKAKHLFRAYNNLYSLHPTVDYESLDFVYNKNSVNTTKFGIVLLNEWMKYIKRGGYLILLFKCNSFLNPTRTQRIFAQYLARYSSVELMDCGRDGCVVVLKKNANHLKPKDSVDKWSFGVLTIGKRNEWVREYINSIRGQKIPHYEIIIIGTWKDDSIHGTDIVYIPFTEKDDRGWITRKKNIIFERARYENVFILHDRFYLDRDWYRNVKALGNYWDGLFFPMKDKNGTECTHWSTLGRGLLPIGCVDIRDWGEDYFAGGTFMAIKKSIWEKVKWDEKLFWGELEDCDYGARFTKAGFVARPNPHAWIHTFVTTQDHGPSYTYNPLKLGTLIEKRVWFWYILQPAIDIPSRILGVRFLRLKMALVRWVKKYTAFSRGHEVGGKRV